MNERMNQPIDCSRKSIKKLVWKTLREVDFLYNQKPQIRKTR